MLLLSWLTLHLWVSSRLRRLICLFIYEYQLQVLLVAHSFIAMPFIKWLANERINYQHLVTNRIRIISSLFFLLLLFAFSCDTRIFRWMNLNYKRTYRLFQYLMLFFPLCPSSSCLFVFFFPYFIADIIYRVGFRSIVNAYGWRFLGNLVVFFSPIEWFVLFFYY